MKERTFNRIAALIYFTLMAGGSVIVLVLHSYRPGGLNFGDGMMFGVVLSVLMRTAFRYARTGSII